MFPHTVGIRDNTAPFGSIRNCLHRIRIDGQILCKSAREIKVGGSSGPRKGARVM